VLGGFLYDLLTSGLFTELLPAEATAVPEPVRQIVRRLLTALATDAPAQRAFLPALLAFLADDVAPLVLVDVANLLEGEALDGVFDLVLALASGQCQSEALR